MTNEITLLLGGVMVNATPIDGQKVTLSAQSLNRHGLISGATGTGKTKSLQVLIEELSGIGVPSLVMDIKGDISGLGAEGSTNKIIEKRAHHIQMDWVGKSFPIEFMSISDEPGILLKSTISEFGPVILSKILSLNETQTSLLSILFLFCDDKKLPLLDLNDLKTVLRYASNEGKDEIQKMYGLVPISSAHAIMRRLTQLEQQGGNQIFGEPSFDVDDLCKVDENGLGMINIIRLTDVQSKPTLFSAFMLALLAEVFEVFPEKGDVDKPELVIFIDEAHLIFKNASKELLDQLDTIIKLIRSKGIGIVFITQTPDDIPENILSQLGFKIQHALRAFTAKDRKAIKLLSQNFPESDVYNVENLITELGIGEALISSLDRKGRPTPLVHSLMRPPYSRMDILNPSEINSILKKSELGAKYNQEIDRESAHEILMDRIEHMLEKEEEEEEEKEATIKTKPKTRRREKTQFEQIMTSSIGTTIVRELTRGILGVFGISTSTRRTSSKTKSKAKR
ncbi:ATPase [Labilibaculum filiforme]|uniref:ATPase n=1 Tax=Labilibaculum filiforme TaxID=1940526 RepID=A0A2N3HU62_9BACT|nr:helicase HerA-like domain-containing protein [Labilibaculum filiforme]PKQ61579.1 ATPase [Labilibaculum filiforme]